MKPRLHFIVPGPVAASERVRKIPFLKPGGGLGVRGVTPAKSRDYMQFASFYASRAAAAVPLWTPIVQKKQAVRVHLHVIREKWLGDIDNFVKQILDALGQSKAVFFNDNRVTELLASIRTDPKAGQGQRAEITVEPASALLEVPLWMQCAIESFWSPPAEVEALRAERDEARDLVRQVRGLVDETRFPHVPQLCREAVQRWGAPEASR